jgi:hypothetical protein
MSLVRIAIMRQTSQKKPRTAYPRLTYGELTEILPVITGARRERFESKIDRSAGLFACHPWRGSRMPTSYGLYQGSVDYRGFSFLAHRIAWALAEDREIPDGLIIRHACDNPPCCNRRHLLIGTHADNMQDAIDRQRTRGAQGRAGADANAADYSWDDRREAERLRFDERWPIAAIATRIGCHRATIMRWLQDPSRDGRLRLDRR